MAESSNVMVKTLCFVVLLACIFFGCKKDALPEPSGYVRSIELSLEDTSCTDAWVRMKLVGVSPPQSVQLKRFDPSPQTPQPHQLITSDSLFVDEGLLPNHTYIYKAYRISGSQLIDSSADLSITTMDTTSHDWDFDPPVLLGDGNSSVLYDVAIINDTLAYAVGEIYKLDSAGNWINPPFNVAKWNGRQWEFSTRLYDCRIYFPNCGPGYYLFTPIQSLFAFGPNDIWIAAGTAQHWDGSQWTEFAGVQGVGGANKIWGNLTTRELYFVGNGGFIAYRSASGTWGRIEGGTTLPLNDVWGGRNIIAGENIVLATASDVFTQGGGKIIRVKSNGMADSLTWGTIYRTPQSIWFDDRDIFVCGSTFWKRRYQEGWQELIAPSFYLNCVRGTSSNDLWMVGHFGLVIHFNGWSVRSYPETMFSTGNYKSVAVTSNHIIAVGRTGSYAVVLMGRRY